MNIKKESLWYVPTFCFLAGIISDFIMTWEVRLFASENLGNNSMYFYTSRFLVLYGINLLLIIIVSFFIFRRISRNEILFSALLMVVIQIIFLIIQVISGELLNVIFFYLSKWCTFFAELTHEKLNNQLIGNVIQCFAPLIFVLFGKKSK